MRRSMWKKPTTYLVLATLAFLLFAIEKAEAETVVEYSPVVAVSGDVQKNWGALMLHERFKGKYSAGVILLVDTDDRANSNKGIEVLRYAEYNKWEVGLGFTAWARESKAWNAKQTFTLMLGREFGRCAARLRHWSTGGTSSRNAGLDMLTFGCMFGAK